MTDFKLKFRGVRGSFPVADKKFLQYGGNTSCVEVNAGGHTIILDAGTGIVKAGDELMEKYAEKYGPIKVGQSSTEKKWGWVTTPFPWERGES